MEFRLTYRGPLKAEGRGGGRAKEKHNLRRHFHQQLRELWKHHPDLRRQANALCYLSDRGVDGQDYVFLSKLEQELCADSTNVKPYIEHIADDHKRGDGRFVPLITENNGFICALDILFLRRDNPGGLIIHGSEGGDIDNRIKVLLDGLKMPKTMQDLGGVPIDPTDEDPFYTLLEDDFFITNLSVTTDRLLTPLTDNEKLNDVDIVVHVTVNNPGAIFAGGHIV